MPPSFGGARSCGPRYWLRSCAAVSVLPPTVRLADSAVTPDNAVAFDFDHRDRSEKRGLIGNVRGRITVVEEMAKCDLLCAVCHRLKTHRAGEHMPLSVANVVTRTLHPSLFDVVDGTATYIRTK